MGVLKIKTKNGYIPVGGASNESADLTGYATESWVQDNYQGKGNYLTEHQDISGKLDADKLPEAINEALAQAKESGKFDGDDYVLTEADKSEIAEMTADLVDVSGSDEIYVLGDGETIEDAPTDAVMVISPDGYVDIPSSGGNVDLTGVVKSVNGVTPDENGNVEITVSGGTAAAIDYDQNVHSVNHRGYSASAPENTIPAYILSKQMGFTYAEADVSFTSDGVAVLLHDATIDRTSNGSGSISAMTYAEASKYDYGSWKNTKYTGTRIPTFEEFIILCKRIGLHPYIEMKKNGAYTQAKIQALVEMVKNCGMDGKVTWISFSADYLRYVKTADSSARLGYLVSSVTSAVITTTLGLKTDTNEVFIDSSDYDADAISLCQAAGLPLEIWTINSSSIIQNMNAYITGVTSDNLIAGKILHDAGMVYEYGIDGDSPVVPDEPDEPDEPEKTLTSISATYSGGSVAVGTAVTALNGIVVTAHYSDDSSEPVTGYTLSGTIADGRNTITVTYEGKTTTFVVTGEAVSGDDNVGDDTRTLLYNWDFTKSLVDTVNGTQATLVGAATQNANGLTITDKTSGANFGTIAKKGMTFEVDIAESSTITNLTTNGRLLCFNASDGNANGTGVVWRGSESAWNTYIGVWGTPYSNNPALFSGKTMTVVINDEGAVWVYSGGEVQAATIEPVNFDSNGYVHLGSYGTAAAGMVITALRIYDGAHYIPQYNTGAWVDDTVVIDASLFGKYRIGKDYNATVDGYAIHTDVPSRLTYTGVKATLHPGYEYTATVQTASGQITNIGVQQINAYVRVIAKEEIENNDSGWQTSGYTFTQNAENYDVAWITLAMTKTGDAIPDGELISVTITRRKV